MLEETKARVATKGIELAVGPRLLERIIADGYSLEYGVRPLRQVRPLRLLTLPDLHLLCVVGCGLLHKKAASGSCNWPSALR